MEDKTQYEIFMEGLKKLENDFRDVVTELGDILAKILPDIEISDEEEEDTWEMKCPYKDRDKYYIVNSRGLVKFLFWDNCVANKKTFNQGHIFPTKQEAELEAKRRNLLTRFRAFRDECNGGWKPDWSSQDKKWEIDCDYQGLKPLWINKVNGFPTFGHFKNEEDAERAIELFGDEIEELFVEGEAQ